MVAEWEFRLGELEQFHLGDMAAQALPFRFVYPHTSDSFFCASTHSPNDEATYP